MLEFEWSIWLMLFIISLVAGLVDAIAGGGGLLIIPVLFIVLDNPVDILATNKMQGVCAALAALVIYARQGHIHFHTMKKPALLAALGGLSGTLMVTVLSTDKLVMIMPFLLVAMTLYFAFSPNLSDVSRAQRLSMGLFAIIPAFAIGFYDGFFGPGAGSFYVLAGLALLGFSAVTAIANAKLLNLASNMASLLVFLLHGHGVWQLGVLMGIGQILGAVGGAKLAMHQGKRLVKPVLVTVTLLMTIRLGWQQYSVL